MGYMPWDPELYNERDREAALRCRDIVLGLGHTPRSGHPALEGYGSAFIRVLAEFGWLLPYYNEVAAKFDSSRGAGDEGWRCAAQTSFTWEAGITLAAANRDPASLSVTVQKATGRNGPTRGKFSYLGRSGAVRVGNWAGGTGVEFAMQLGLPGHAVIRLSGRVDEALSRFGRVCVPERLLDALCDEGLLEFTPPEGHRFDEGEESARHNRVGYWCGVASRTQVTHVKVSWSDKA